ncbi:hypothetical protein BLNAU_2594 [Blattamonas nauphoetae]|uniref:Calcineurin-like phosphoesterase domain-containing protein n=1 Tax=Blattamonas nauphoetae TaxID=2049346 RepID=A0ABQ9YF01_9EUKA|nr:hypothetical protein BLNAU_2594 [Blattamonas nauphoetae]
MTPIAVIFFLISGFTANTDQINSRKFSFVYTSDIHATLNPTRIDTFLSAQFPDLINFIEHLKRKNPDRDVYWFDSGDFARGSCFSDCEEPYGAFVFDQLVRSRLAATTVGEHDLLTNQASETLHGYAHPYTEDDILLKNRIITTNVFWDDYDSPFGEPHLYIPITNSSKKILVLGFSAPYPDHPSRIFYHSIDQSLKSSYFNDSLKDPDIALVVCLCHLDLDSGEAQQIRDFFVKRKTPLVLLCGRSHLYKERVDETAIMVEDGAFLQTFRVIHFEIDPTNPSIFQEMGLEWFDMQKSEMMDSLGIKETEWETQDGKEIRSNIEAFSIQQNITQLMGCPLSQYSSNFTAKESLYTHLVNKVYPALLLPADIDNFPSDQAVLYMTENGSVRQPLGFKAVEKGDAILTDPYDRPFYLYTNLTGAQIEKLKKSIVDPAENINFTQKYKLQSKKLKADAVYTIAATLPHPNQTMGEINTVLGLNHSVLNTTFTSRSILVQFLTTRMNCNKLQKKHIVTSSILIALVAIVVAVSFVFILVWSANIYRKATANIAKAALEQ